MIENLKCIIWVLLGTYIGAVHFELFVGLSGEYNFTAAVIYGLLALGWFQLLDWVFLKITPKACRFCVDIVKNRK